MRRKGGARERDNIRIHPRHGGAVWQRPATRRKTVRVWREEETGILREKQRERERERQGLAGDRLIYCARGSSIAAAAIDGRSTKCVFH